MSTVIARHSITINYVIIIIDATIIIIIITKIYSNLLLNLLAIKATITIIFIKFKSLIQRDCCNYRQGH